MTNVRGLDQDFWVGKVADSVRGLPPWASKFVGKLVALGGLDTIDLVLDDPERACTEETAWEPAAGCATPGAAAPHRDMPVMDKHELRESFMYGCFARCAYFDDDQDTTAVRKVRNFLAGCQIKGKDTALTTSREGRAIGQDLLSSLDGDPILLRYNSPLVTGPVLGTTLVTTDTEVVVFKLTSGELVFAFRGTEVDWSKGLREDALTNALFFQTPLNEMRGMEGRFPPKVKVHKGFLTSFNDVLGRDRKMRTLPEVARQLMRGSKPTRVVCCGHSLGGALATLGAMWAAEAASGELHDLFSGVEVRCYAFASPRVGNLAFAEHFKNKVHRALRFTHKKDIVPVVPPMGYYKHVGQPVMLIEPAGQDLGMLSGVLHSARYLALLRDRPLFGIYLGVGDHAMMKHLLALAEQLDFEHPPNNKQADLLESSCMRGLAKAGVFGRPTTLDAPGYIDRLHAGAFNAASLDQLQQELQWRVQSGGLPEELQPQSPELDDLFDALQQRAGRVEFARQRAGLAVPDGWRMASCADVLTHMHKAWNAISGTKPYEARLSDGVLRIGYQRFSSKIAELSAVPPSTSSSSSADVLLISSANSLSPAMLQRIGSSITDMILAEGGLVRGVLCGEVFFLLSRSEELYAGYRLATCAEVEGRAGISNVQLVDGLMPSDQSWVALGDGWMRNSIVHANISAARFVALHCSRPADLPAAGAAWKLLVRDCDVDKAHKRLEALGSAADSLHSSSGAHAVHGDAWQVVRNGCVPAGWRPASCWEVASLMPCDASIIQLLRRCWTADEDSCIALLDGHIKLPSDVAEAFCLFKLSCRRLACNYQLVINAPASITAEQQQLMDAVHDILTGNQGSAVMASAPAAAGADVRGWLALVRSNHAAAMPGYGVVSYETAVEAKMRDITFDNVLRLMLVKSHHTGTKQAKALLRGGRISCVNLTSKEYILKTFLAHAGLLGLSWNAAPDVDPLHDRTAALAVLLRS